MNADRAYEILRSWYLAKLRRSAIEARTSAALTPAALISADRDVIQKLIAEKMLAQQSTATVSKPPAKYLLKQLLYWLYGLLALVISTWIFCGGNSVLFMEVFAYCVNPLNSLHQSEPLFQICIIVQLVLFVVPLALLAELRLSKRSVQ